MSSAQEAIPAPTAVTVSTAVAAPGSIDMDVSSKRPGNVLGEGSGAGAAVPRARKRRGFAQPETQTPAPGGTALLPAPTLTPVVESVGGPPAEVFPSMKPLNLEEEQRLGRARKFAFEQHLAYKELANHAMHLRAAGVPITSAVSLIAPHTSVINLGERLPLLHYAYSTTILSNLRPLLRHAFFEQRIEPSL